MNPTDLANRIVRRNIERGAFNPFESSMLESIPGSFDTEFSNYADDFNRATNSAGGIEGQSIEWLYTMLHRNSNMNDTLSSLQRDKIPKASAEDEIAYSVKEGKSRLRRTRNAIQKVIAVKTGFIAEPETIDLT